MPEPLATGCWAFQQPPQPKSKSIVASALMETLSSSTVHTQGPSPGPVALSIVTFVKVPPLMLYWVWGPVGGPTVASVNVTVKE